MGSKVKNMVIDRVSMEVYAVSGELGEWPRCGTHSEALSAEYSQSVVKGHSLTHSLTHSVFTQCLPL